jgi:hypothetical protein
MAWCLTDYVQGQTFTLKKVISFDPDIHFEIEATFVIKNYLFKLFE